MCPIVWSLCLQKEMNEVKEKCDSLEKENVQLKRFQENCMFILETRNCDAGKHETQSVFPALWEVCRV